MSKYTDVIPADIEESLGWLLDSIEPNKRLLDVGCSTGYFGSYLKQSKNLTVDGIEISEDKEEAKKVLDHVYSFDLESPWPSNIRKNRYDYILFGDILEHLRKPEEVLLQMRKLLKPGGLAFISIPNIAHISTRLELLNGEFGYESTGLLDDTHLRFFTMTTLQKMINDAGFHIVNVNYSFNDYPKTIIRNLINKAGLKPTEKFWEIANSPEARAFQYKVIIQAKGSPNQKTHRTPMPEKPEHYRDSFIKDLQTQVANIDTHAKEQAKIIAAQEQKITQLKSPVGWLKFQLSRVKNRLK